jgi:hypothetical protein
MTVQDKSLTRRSLHDSRGLTSRRGTRVFDTFVYWHFDQNSLFDDSAQTLSFQRFTIAGPEIASHAF